MDAEFAKAIHELGLWLHRLMAWGAVVIVIAATVIMLQGIVRVLLRRPKGPREMQVW
jgi:hypothetical protein